MSVTFRRVAAHDEAPFPGGFLLDVWNPSEAWSRLEPCSRGAGNRNGGEGEAMSTERRRLLKQTAPVQEPEEPAADALTTQRCRSATPPPANP